MPASGRLAIGAVVAALLLDAGRADPRRALVLGFVSAAGGGLAWLASALVRRPRIGRAAVVVAAGAGILALRLALAPLAMPPSNVELPPNGTAWTATVLTVSPLRAGTRPALLQLEAPAGALVAATLPAWPTVVPGDRLA